MLIILHGEDTFRSRQKLKELTDEKNAERFDVEEASWQEVKKELDNNSLFSSEKCVVLEDVSKNKDVLSKLVEYVRERGVAKDKNTTLIIFESATLPKDVECQELLKEASSTKEFKKLNVAEAAKWLSQHFTEKGMSISANIVREVVAACRADMWQSYNELFKLYAYKAGGNITKQDLEIMNIGSEEAQIFPTIDAIFAGRTDLAFKNLQIHWQEGEHPHYVFTMIERQLRIAASIKEEKERGSNPASIAKKLSQHPYVVQKTMPMVNRFSWDKIKGLYARIESLDVKSKSGQMDPRLATELLAAAVAS
ncbi:MAG: DNA polymerase III subunit delta [Candidatus Spechtbacterales bacterium]